MNLTEAIKDQTTRLLEKEQSPLRIPDTEISDLLQAFMSLVGAYLSRVTTPKEVIGIESPMDVKKSNTYTNTFSTDN